jgi:hypothetical protein
MMLASWPPAEADLQAEELTFKYVCMLHGLDT